MSRAPCSQCAGPASRWSSSRRCRGCAWQTSGSPRRVAPTPRRRRCGSPGALIPGRVPPVVDSDAVEHVVVLQHAPRGWRNWQTEMLAGRAHAASGRWAGETLGRLHSATAGDAEVAAAFGDYEAFAQLRLEPYHGVVMERLPRPRPCAGAARRRAARRAHVPRARRLRTQEHPARPRRRVGAGRRGRALRPPGLRPRVLPRVPAAHGARAPRALRRPAASSCTASPRPTPVARRALACHALVGGRPHRRDAARAHRRALAGDVPGHARGRGGARTRSSACCSIPTADLAAVVASCG